VKTVVNRGDCVLDPSKMIENIKILFEHQPIQNRIISGRWFQVNFYLLSFSASSFSFRELWMTELFTSMETHPELTGLRQDWSKPVFRHCGSFSSDCLCRCGLRLRTGSQLSTLSSRVFFGGFSLLSVCDRSLVGKLGGGIPVHLKDSFESVNDRFILRGDLVFNLTTKWIIQYFREEEEFDVAGVIGEVGTDLRVVSLGLSSFVGNSILKSIWFPSSVEMLSEGCFCACEHLSSVLFEITCQASVLEEAFGRCDIYFRFS
jgi:hypothetical protein